MVTAIASSKNTIDATIDSRFGRSPFFAIYNEETKQTIFIENEFKDESGGVGPKIVNKLSEYNVKKIVAVEFGPKAKDIIEALKIQMIVFNDTSKTINEIIQLMDS